MATTNGFADVLGLGVGGAPLLSAARDGGTQQTIVTAGRSRESKRRPVVKHLEDPLGSLSDMAHA
jgi:hypothetical protein